MAKRSSRSGGGAPYNFNRSLLAAGLVGLGFLSVLAGSRKLHQSVLLEEDLRTKQLNKAQIEAKRKTYLEPYLANPDPQTYRRNILLKITSTGNTLPLLEEEAKNPQNKEAKKNLTEAQNQLKVAKEALFFIDEYLAAKKAQKTAQEESKIRKFQEKAKVRPPRKTTASNASTPPAPRMYIETEAIRQKKQQQKEAEEAAAAAELRAKTIPIPNPSTLGFLPVIAPAKTPPPKKKGSSPGGPLLPF